MLRYFIFSTFLISIWSCNQKIGKNSLPPESNTPTKSNSITFLDISDTIQGRAKLNKTFNSSHFVQMVDGESTILKATLHDFEPPEGMKDGGERITFYTLIKDPEKLEIGKVYPIDDNIFRNRLEMVYDPNYESFEQTDLVGNIKFISVEPDQLYIYQLTIGEKGNEKLVAKDVIVRCRK